MAASAPPLVTDNAVFAATVMLVRAGEQRGESEIQMTDTCSHSTTR